MFNWHASLSPFGSWHNGENPFSPSGLLVNSTAFVWYDPSDVANTNWRRNLLTWTEQFDNAVWVKEATAATANAATAPDATTTADRLAETTATSAHAVSQTLSSLSATQHVFSVYLKKGTGATAPDWVQVTFGGASTGFANFNVSTGVVGVTSSATASISSVGSGWYRCSVVVTVAVSGAASVQIVFTNNTDTATRRPSYAGATTSDVLVWGAQLEVGSVATEYQRITDVNTEVIERFPTATLYQDAAGTTPVTAPAQPVGLVLDKSQGLVLGPELVTNGTFSDALNGWTLSPVGTGTATVVNGQAVLQFNTSANRGRITQQITTVSGRYYEVLLTVVSGTPNLFVGTTSTANDTFAANSVVAGSYRYLVAAGSSFWLTVVPNPSSTVDAVVDNISVRELPGFHAFTPAASPDSRPTYGVVPSRGRVNLLTFTEQFDNAVWSKSASGTGVAPVLTINAAVAPDGTMTADRVDFNRGAGNTLSDRSILSQSLSSSDNVSVVGSVYLRAATAGDIGKTIAVRTASGSAYTEVTLTADWVRFSNTGITTVRTIELESRGAASASNAVSALVWGAQLEVGSTATTYQRVVSQFDVTDPVGFPSYPLHYLFFDAVDDFLQTSTITPNADKMTVVAGVRKLSDAALSAVVEVGVGGGNGTAGLGAPGVGGGATYRFLSQGTIGNSANSAASFPAPDTAVITGLGDISGDSAILRRNGVQVAQNTADQGTGNYLAYPLYIGRRGGTTLPFNGQLYGLITRFSTANLDASLISNTEQWMGGKTGVTIA